MAASSANSPVRRPRPKAGVADGVTRELTADFVLNGAATTVPPSARPAAAALAGILAAVLPSVRAVRLNILTAIAADG